MPNVTIRVNRVDENIDEVFIYREDPYLNRAVYAKRGVFTAGELSDDDVMVLEQKSVAILANERAKVLAREPAKSAAATTGAAQEPKSEAGNEEA